MFRTGGLLSNIFTLCVIIFLISVIINPGILTAIIQSALGIFLTIGIVWLIFKALG